MYYCISLHQSNKFETNNDASWMKYYEEEEEEEEASEWIT